MRRLTLTSAAIAWLLAAAFAGGAGPSAAPQPAPALLPDLRQEVPLEWGLAAVREGGRVRYLLGFRSAVQNVGRGPLIVVGSRAALSDPFMTAAQKVLHADGSVAWVPGVGRLEFEVNPTHQHWHYLGFERYELRSARRYRKLRRGRKTGFCLGDRYAIELRPTAAPVMPAYPGIDCGSGEPGLLTLEQGISAGWGDNYDPHKEGQHIDLTGVKAGRYYVVHRVDPAKRLREVRRDNNAASALLSVRWPRGKRRPPRVKVIAECPRGDRCSGPRLHFTVPLSRGPVG